MHPHCRGAGRMRRRPATRRQAVVEAAILLGEGPLVVCLADLHWLVALAHEGRDPPGHQMHEPAADPELQDYQTW